MTVNRYYRALSGVAAVVTIAAHGGGAMAAADPGKKACVEEARRLCPAEMRSFSRKRVEACMIVKIEQTSPMCHAAMLRIKADREGAVKR